MLIEPVIMTSLLISDPPQIYLSYPFWLLNIATFLNTKQIYFSIFQKHKLKLIKYTYHGASHRLLSVPLKLFPWRLLFSEFNTQLKSKPKVPRFSMISTNKTMNIKWKIFNSIFLNYFYYTTAVEVHSTNKFEENFNISLQLFTSARIKILSTYWAGKLSFILVIKPAFSVI